MNQENKIGFIGVGVMGSSMATHLINKGYTLHIYNRTKSKAEPLIKKGSSWCDSPAEVAKQSDIVFTMVGTPKDVEKIYLRENLITNLKSGGIAIDMTTSSPALAKKINEIAKKRNCHFLD